MARTRGAKREGDGRARGKAVASDTPAAANKHASVLSSRASSRNAAASKSTAPSEASGQTAAAAKAAPQPSTPSPEPESPRPDDTVQPERSSKAVSHENENVMKQPDAGDDGALAGTCAPPASNAASGEVSSPGSAGEAPEQIKDPVYESADEEEDANGFWVNDKMLKAEQEAQHRRLEAERDAKKPVLTKDRQQKLDKLLEQAQMYSTFLVEQVSTVQDEWEQHDAVAAQAALEAEEAQDEAPGGKRKRKGSSGKASKRAKTNASKAAAKTPTQTLLPLIQGDLKLFQLKGVAWLISLWTNGINGILADQMGLGKTVQTIGFLSHLRSNNINGPFLIVVPLSTLMNWKNEIARWCPSMNALIYHGDKFERADIAKKWFKPEYKKNCPPDFPVLVTSFEIAIRDRKQLGVLEFKYLVVDEGHRLKNSDCRLTRELRELKVENKLLLTGTPLQNNLAELWSLLNFLLPTIFNNLGDFESWFDFSSMVSSDEAERAAKSKEILESEAKDRMVSKLHDILKPFLLRRVKVDVEKSLPAKQEVVVYAPQTAAQRDIQKKLVSKDFIAEVQAAADNGGKAINLGKLNNMLMQLRKNCNHPDLITCEWTDSTTYPPADELVKQSGKMQILDKLLSRLKATGHKVLVFSQFTKMLDILDSYLEERGHSVRRIDGNVDYQTRMTYMDEYNSDPDCFVFLLSTRAGGLGINLTSADTVIFYDSDWNPHQDMQAMDRAHRIGQTKPVLVLRLCTLDSVEVKLLRRANSKLALERLVIKRGHFQGAESSDAATAGSRSNVLSAEDLLDVLQGTSRKQEDANHGAITDDMLDELLDRTHLAAKQPPPYSLTGTGYEVVADAGGGMLASVQ